MRNASRNNGAAKSFANERRCSCTDKDNGFGLLDNVVDEKDEADHADDNGQRGVRTCRGK